MELAGKADAIGVHLSGNSCKNSVDNMSRKLLSMMHLTDFLDGSSVVFFDLFHRVTIVYDGNTAIVLYILILFFTSSVWIIKVTQWTAYDWIACSRMALILVSCVVASFASATFGSFIYSDLLGLKLVWYGSTQKALLIYVPHVLFGFTSMLLFLLPRKLSVNRFDHMLLAKTLYCLAMATYFMQKRIMSAYLPLSMVLIISICAIQGRRVSAFLRHLQIAITIAMLTANQTKSTLAVTLPIIGFTRTDAVPHDTIAALIVAYCCSNLVVVPCLPILCEYAAALRRLVRFFLVTSLFVAFSFLLMEERIQIGFKSSTLLKKISSDKHVPYSKEAPKRLTVVHFHSPNMTPSSVLMLAKHDALMANERRILSPLFSSDQEVASLSADPKFGVLEGTPMEAFYLYASKVQSKTFLRTSRAPELPTPTLQKAAEQRVAQGWNVSYILKGSDSHVLSLRFAKNDSSMVRGWSFSFDVNTAPNMTWIRYDGSDSFSFWLLLEGNTDGPSVSPPTVTFMVSSARYGASRSKDDLSKLNFEFWESPSVMVSSAAEYVL